MMSSSDQERNLDLALDSLRAGKEQKARDTLERVVKAAPLDGVTDEALFRLALLQLGSEGGKGVFRARSLLERLMKEYPGSLWARQAVPVAAYLTSANLHDRELKTLRDLNLSLSRDNRELHQSIERLKSLDKELERKTRH
jgi:predicted Zn-dependent protease